MPTSRRKIHLLVQDAAGTVPTTKSAERYAYAQRRCVECQCVLARDNTQPHCSPCQRRLGGVPDTLSLYLPQRPEPLLQPNDPSNRAAPTRRRSQS